MSNGENLWIIKPGGLSRGRQIKVMQEFGEIFEYCKSETKSVFGSIDSNKKWIAQKYLETPKLMQGRKFDFRIWVVVVSWNPYLVYWYTDFYLRLGSESYSTKNIKNLFSHLTNHSINKKKIKPNEIYNAP